MPNNQIHDFEPFALGHTTIVWIYTSTPHLDPYPFKFEDYGLVMSDNQEFHSDRCNTIN